MDKETELVEKISAQIVQWEAEIDRLSYQAENGSEQEKKACLAQIDVLQRKRAEAQATLQGIGTENTDTVEDIKKGAHGVLDNVKSGLRDAILKIK
jgi:cell division protein FtsB